MNKLLSFINMDDDIIKQFINEISRDLLLVPVVNDKKYSKRPGIKGFRREKISKNILDSLYFSEIKKNKSSSKLGNFIIEAIDKNMKDCLADDSYKVLQEEDFEKVITVLEEYFNSSKRMFKKKYVRGLMNLPDDISAKFDAEDLKEKLKLLENDCLKYREEYDREKETVREKDIQIDNLKRDIDNLKEELLIQKNRNKDLIIDYEKKLQNLEVEKESRSHETDSFVDTRIEINLQEILEELIERIQKSSAIEFNEYYKSLNLENCNTQNIEAILAEKKKDVIKKNDYESAIQLTLIELVLLEISGSLKEYE